MTDHQHGLDVDAMVTHEDYDLMTKLSVVVSSVVILIQHACY